MKTRFADRSQERRIVRILGAGFGLVIFLLIGASLAVERNARRVQADLAAVASERLLSTQLLSELQLEQAALNELFHRVARRDSPLDQERLERVLRQTELVLERAAGEAAVAGDAARWAELQGSVRQFASDARRILEDGRPTPAALERLLLDHSRVLARVAGLVENSSARAAEAGARLAASAEASRRESLALLGTALGLSIAGAALTARAASRLFGRLRDQERELSGVSWRMLESQEEVLRRFSHELHDDLGQSLAAASSLVEKLEPATLDGGREECLAVLAGAISNVRELSQLLRPVILDDFGLDASLRWLGERFAERTRIEFRYSSNFSGRLHDELETHLYRMTQEALTNVARHSRARSVRVSLERTEDEVRLVIADDGRGLPGSRDDARLADAETPPKVGLGLIGMQARARRIGGQVRIDSPPEGGVIIEARAPYRPPDEPGEEDAAAAG